MADDYISGNWSSGSPGTTPHTPLEQGPPAFMLHGVGSSTSICTTDDEDNESQFPWTEEQEQYVVQILQEYQDNPHNTPFSGRFPPSGVVQRVARRVMRRAPRNTFPHSLIAVRKRILLICARENPEEAPPAANANYPEHAYTGSYGGQSSAQFGGSLSAQGHGGQTSSLGSSFGGPLGGQLGGPLGGSFAHPQASLSQFGAPLPNLSVNTSEYEQFDFGQSSQPVVLASPFKEDQRFQQPRSQGQQAQAQAQNPNSPHGSGSLDSNVLNIVAQRKRDSLKMKRGLK